MRLITYSIAAIFPLVISLPLPVDRGNNSIRPGISRIADKLQKEDLVHFGNAVGFSARRETGNKYYKLYLKLKRKASNEELAALTKRSSKIIKIYAFAILRDRKYNELKNIFFQNASDTSWFWTAAGCTGAVDQVNSYMFRAVRPSKNDTLKGHLSKEEYELYRVQFRRQDSLISAYENQVAAMVK